MEGSSRAARIAGSMRLAGQLARDWQRRIPEDDRRYAPWMPFPLPAFIALLAEALPEADGDYFLEAGCGPGPGMLLARDIFGLDAHGFDRVREYVIAARTLGLNADVADAAEYAGYGKARLIWFNRVARDPVLQARIEAKVWRDAAPGAVVMCAHLESPPPETGWAVILDDWGDLRRGIWRKLPHIPSAGW